MLTKLRLNILFTFQLLFMSCEIFEQAFTQPCTHRLSVRSAALNSAPILTNLRLPAVNGMR
jgi:hypothetical protein